MNIFAQHRNKRCIPNNCTGEKTTSRCPQYGRLLPIDEENTQLFSSAVYEKGYTMHPHNVKSLRPECSTDAPCFLNAVYKSSTQMKKAQADVLQYGRSMIEMIGVLAIIGVLSIGGIAGYSKALHRHQINKTIEQISVITNGVRKIYAGRRNYTDKTAGPVGKYHSLNNNVLKKSKVVPEDMWEGNNLKSVWDTDFTVDGSALDEKNLTGGTFAVCLWKIPSESCVDLITQDWPSEIEGIYVKSNLGANSKLVISDCNSSGTSVGDGLFCRKDKGLPISIDQAIGACNCTNNLCDIAFGTR